MRLGLNLGPISMSGRTPSSRQINNGFTSFLLLIGYLFVGLFWIAWVMIKYFFIAILFVGRWAYPRVDRLVDRRRATTGVDSQTPAVPAD